MSGPQRLLMAGGSAAAPAPPGTPWAWWDASDSATITHSSNAVSQWNDKSGNGFHLTQGTSANRPTTNTRTLNSLNVLDFDGTNDSLSRSAAVGLGMSNFTAVFVGGQDNTQIVAGLVIAHNGGNDYDSGNAFCFNTSNHGASKVIGFDQAYIGSPESGTRYVSGGTGATPVAVWAVRKTSVPLADIWKNGVAQTTSGTTNGAGGTANAGLVIGARYIAGVAGPYLDGPVAEVIIYASALSDPDMVAVDAYLGTKWGL